jgi:hypothetical protein
MNVTGNCDRAPRGIGGARVVEKRVLRRERDRARAVHGTRNSIRTTTCDGLHGSLEHAHGTFFAMTARGYARQSCAFYLALL